MSWESTNGRQKIRSRQADQIETLIMNVGLFVMLQTAGFAVLALLIGGLR